MLSSYPVISILISFILLVDWSVVHCEVEHLGVDPQLVLLVIQSYSCRGDGNTVTTVTEDTTELGDKNEEFVRTALSPHPEHEAPALLQVASLT